MPLAVVCLPGEPLESEHSPVAQTCCGMPAMRASGLSALLGLRHRSGAWPLPWVCSVPGFWCKGWQCPLFHSRGLEQSQQRLTPCHNSRTWVWNEHPVSPTKALWRNLNNVGDFNRQDLFEILNSYMTLSVRFNYWSFITTHEMGLYITYLRGSGSA